MDLRASWYSQLCLLKHGGLTAAQHNFTGGIWILDADACFSLISLSVDLSLHICRIVFCLVVVAKHRLCFLLYLCCFVKTRKAMGTAQTEAVRQSALKRLSPQKDSLASALYFTSRLVAGCGSRFFAAVCTLVQTNPMRRWMRPDCQLCALATSAAHLASVTNSVQVGQTPYCFLEALNTRWKPQSPPPPKCSGHVMGHGD